MRQIALSLRRHDFAKPIPPWHRFVTISPPLGSPLNTEQAAANILPPFQSPAFSSAISASDKAAASVRRTLLSTSADRANRLQPGGADDCQQRGCKVPGFPDCLTNGLRSPAHIGLPPSERGPRASSRHRYLRAMPSRRRKLIWREREEICERNRNWFSITPTTFSLVWFAEHLFCCRGVAQNRRKENEVHRPQSRYR